MKIFTFCIVILIFTFLFFNFTQAANGGLVPCSGLDCDFCDLFKLGENVFTFAIFNVALPIAVIFVIYGGFKIMTAGSSPEKVSEGRKIIQAAAIGILIVLLAWLFVDTILNILAGQELKEWWNPQSKITNC